MKRCRGTGGRGGIQTGQRQEIICLVRRERVSKDWEGKYMRNVRKEAKSTGRQEENRRESAKRIRV